MAKITCYMGQIEALAKYIYNPNSMRAVRLGEKGEVLDTQEILHPMLGALYKREGKTLEIEEEDFDNIYNKFTQMENLKRETTGLVKKILSQL